MVAWEFTFKPQNAAPSLKLQYFTQLWAIFKIIKTFNLSFLMENATAASLRTALHKDLHKWLEIALLRTDPEPHQVFQFELCYNRHLEFFILNLESQVLK